MFGISFYEMLVIAVVGLIVFKPKDIISLIIAMRDIIARIKEVFFKVQEDMNKIEIMHSFDEYLIIDKKDKISTIKDDEEKL